jgi:alpha-L-arabinofuranosidase
MKSVEPQINIGVVLCPIYWDNWNRRVLNVVKDKVDFGIVHTYPVPEEGDLRLMGAKQIFEISLGVPVFGDEVNFQHTLKLLKAESGRDIPLAITEYNGGFTQEKPVPYRHCLGTALINAELLRIFMKPEHKILMANYWQFCNSYWGMVKSQEDFMKHDYSYPIAYIKRPNYYVFELYTKHFGSELIMADVESGFYREKGFSIPYLTVNTSVNEDKSKIYLLVVNKNLAEPVCARIHLKDFLSSGGGDAWILNGPSIDATNEKNPNNVKVMHRKFEIRDNPFGFTFEPHSLTAIEITGRKDE